MHADAGLSQVYVVTSGEYSDYGIASIWLTMEEAKAEADTWGRVEVWPIGENKRTRGSFSRSAQVDFTTGAVSEGDPSDGPDLLDQEHVSVLCWPDSDGVYAKELGIRVSCDTEERANKVYSEVRARVLAEISQGLPIEAIADSKYTGGGWKPTGRRIAGEHDCGEV